MTTADKIRTAAARAIGYTIQGEGFKRQHHTLTLRAALQWAACYPAATITRKGRFIASKTTGGQA
jgi:hypothetical protein